MNGIMSVLTFFFRKAGNGSSLKKNPERKKKSACRLHCTIAGVQCDSIRHR